VQDTKSSNKLELNPKVFEGVEELNPVHTNGEINDEIYQRFIDSIIDQNRHYPDPTPIIKLVYKDEIFTLLTEKSFALVQGKQKSKKTVFLILLVVAFLRNTLCSDSIYLEGDHEGVALWFDTEQGESYAARTLKTILNLAGVDSTPRLIYCDLREFTPKQRVEIIQRAIEKTPNVRLVVIDGLIDLISNWREPEESHELFTKIIRWCSIYNVNITGVLHQNKADRNAREIIGTIASQKCEIEITVEVDAADKARSLVSCLNSRGLPFEPFSIRWDKGSLPFIEQEYTERVEKKKTAGDKLYERGKRVVENVFKPLAALSYTEAWKAIMNEEPCGKTTAQNRIEDYQTWGFIEMGADGKYRKKLTG